MTIKTCNHLPYLSKRAHDGTDANDFTQSKYSNPSDDDDDDDDEFVMRLVRDVCVSFVDSRRECLWFKRMVVVVVVV